MGRKAYGVANRAGEIVADDPLSFTWAIPLEAMRKAGVGPSGSRKRDHVLGSVLAAAINAHMTGDTGEVSFSCRKMFYEDTLRYRDILFTRDLIMSTVKFAEGLGLLEVHWAKSGDNFRKLGQSRFKATAKLVAAFQGTAFDYRDDKPSVILKNEDGHRMRVEMTPELAAMTARIDRINQAFANVEFTLPAECERIDPQHVRCPVDLSKPRRKPRKKAVDEDEHPRKTHHIVRTEKRIKIRRVFNGSWELGGRAYWWGQCLRSDHRKRSQIDSEDVVELDFEAFHPTMLYDREVLPRPAEPYQFPRADKGDREVWPKGPSKTCWVVGINADCERDTILKVMDEHDMTWGDAAALYNDMKRHHAPIAQYLGSGVGLSLMRDDSEIALEVVEECLERGIIALPVHDSFIVQRRHEAALDEIMKAAMVRYKRKCAQARTAMLDDSVLVDIEPPAIEEATPVAVGIQPAIVEVPAVDRRPIIVPLASSECSPHKLLGRAGLPLGVGAGVLASFRALVLSGGVPVGPHAVADENLLDARAPRRPREADLLFFTHLGFWADPDAHNPHREACRTALRRLDRDKARRAPAASPPPRRRRSAVAPGVDRRKGFNRPSQNPSPPVAVSLAALDPMSARIIALFPGSRLIEVQAA